MTHKPVLLREVIKVFDESQKIRIFFDGTLGAGGHAREILVRHPEIEIYIGCDRDLSALSLAKENLKDWKEKVQFIHGCYAQEALHQKELFDGFLIDIGVSSMQLNEASRGFSFSKEAPLDMRMDLEAFLTAEMIVNQWSEKELARILFEYGEERRSRKIAKAIVEVRKKKPIRTTKELVDVIRPVATRGKLHFATLTFQALRIAVNDELGQLERGLEAGLKKMRSNTRMAVISFHSLEDRIVKHFFKNNKTKCRPLTKKPIQPNLEEIRNNPRSRSSKLRAVEVL